MNEFKWLLQMLSGNLQTNPLKEQVIFQWSKPFMDISGRYAPFTIHPEVHLLEHPLFSSYSIRSTTFAERIECPYRKSWDWHYLRQKQRQPDTMENREMDKIWMD